MSTPSVRVNLPPKVPGGAPPPGTPTPPKTAAASTRHALKAPLSWKDWALRLMLVVVLAAGAAAVLWSYGRLAKAQEKGRGLDEKIAQLTSDVQILEGKYSREDIDKLMARSKEAQALLFAGQDHLYQWFSELKLGLVPLALSARADFGQALTNRSPGGVMQIVPAKVELSVETATGAEPRRSPYQRVMDLMVGLAEQPKRVDVVGLEARGGSNSIAEASVVLELWAGEETKP